MNLIGQSNFFKLKASSLLNLGGLLLLALWILSCDTTSSVQPYRDQTFIKLYGGDGSEQGTDVAVLPDGGYVIVGSSTSRNVTNRNQDVYVVRTDSIGGLVWEVWIDAFDNNLNESANSVLLNDDGSTLYVCGGMESNGAQPENRDVYVVSISLQNGSVLSEHFFGDSLRDEIGTDIIETEEGFFITATSQDLDGSKYFLIETDENLEPLPNRSRYIPFNSNAMNYSTKSYDYHDEFNPFICFGTSDRGSNGNSTFWYQAFTYKSVSNSLGTLEYYGTNEADEYCTDAFQTIDGGFILAGFRQGPSSSNEMIVKIEPENLSVMWSQVYANEFNSDVKDCSIIQTSDGGYLISSTIQLPPPENDEISLLKVDFLGNEVWRNTYGSNENDAGSKVVQLDDNSYVLVGTIGFDINPNSSSKMALLKVSSSGELIPN